MALKWYVVHAYSQYEKKVATAIQERVERLGMADRFGEIIVPTEEVIEMKGGQKRKSERKFFPGYVLVQMELDDDTWHLVKETPRVLGLLAVRPISPRRSPMQKPIRFCNASKRAWISPSQDRLRARRDGPRHRWPIQRLQWCR